MNVKHDYLIGENSNVTLHVLFGLDKKTQQMKNKENIPDSGDIDN